MHDESCPATKTIDEVIAALDPDLLSAQRDVDQTLLDRSLALNPAERLDAAYRFLRDLVLIRERHEASTRR